MVLLWTWSGGLRWCYGRDGGARASASVETMFWDFNNTDDRILFEPLRHERLLRTLGKLLTIVMFPEVRMSIRLKDLTHSCRQASPTSGPSVFPATFLLPMTWSRATSYPILGHLTFRYHQFVAVPWFWPFFLYLFSIPILPPATLLHTGSKFQDGFTRSTKEALGASKAEVNRNVQIHASSQPKAQSKTPGKLHSSLKRSIAG